MLTGNLVRVKVAKQRVIPLYLNPESPDWLEVAESLLVIFREGAGRTRGEIQTEVDELVGEGLSTLAHRGLAKVLEDRAEFEVVADVAPDLLREKVFTAAAQFRKNQLPPARRARFRPEPVLQEVAQELGLTTEQAAAALFADLKDENRMIRFEDFSARRLLERYNVALAQAVLLRSVQLEAQVRHERPARYRQLFRQLKFRRLLYQVSGDMSSGYTFQIDGPLSLFSATNKYGLNMALFLPALLLCSDFRLTAELRWGVKREPRWFHLDSNDGLVSHLADTGTYVPQEIQAFAERFAQVAPDWELTEATDIVPLGREATWIPDYRVIHRASGLDVFLEVLGFWKRSSLERILGLLPEHGPPRYVLLLSDRLKVDEGTLAEIPGPVLRFKEIPNANELRVLLEGFLPP
jgi:uncharacterized protein